MNSARDAKGSSALPTRESMLEAGLRRPSRGTSGGLRTDCNRESGSKRGEGLVGGRRSGSEKRQTWRRPPERSSVPEQRDGSSRRGKRARQGVSVTAPPRLVRGRTNLRGSCHEPSVCGTPRGSDGGRGPPVRRPPTASPLGVGDAACGYPASSWTAQPGWHARGRRSVG